MSRNLIAVPQMRSQIARNHAVKEALWKQTLINNEKGIVTNATGSLKYDDYKELTDDIVKVREYDFIGNVYSTLVGAGLTRSVDISKTMIDYHDMNDVGVAFASMDAANRENAETDYNQKTVPLPIFHKDLVIPWRQEGFSYKQSDGVMQIGQAVAEKRDNVLLFGDTSIKVNGVALTGLTNSTGVQTDTITDWALTGTSGQTIRKETVTMLGTLFTTSKVAAANSCVMFVAGDVFTNLQNDYSTSYESGTILDSLLKLNAIRDIQPQQDLPAGAVLIIELAPRTVDLAIASDIIALPWQKNNQLEDGRFTVLASCTPRVKNDRNGVTGIMYGTK